MKVNAGQTAGMHGAMMPPQAGSMGGMQLAYMQAAQQMGQPGMMLPAMPAGGALPQMVMAPQQQAGLPVAAAGALPMGMLGGGGGLPDPYAPVPPATSPTPFGAPGGGPMMGLDLQLNGGGYGGGGGAPPAAQLSGGDSKHRKTAKQQEANKIAQQRYRERKKQKFVEMEAQISVLSKQLAALQALQSRNQILEGLNGELQTQLMSKEKEVERLKLALDVSAERSLSGHSHPSSPSADGDHGTTTALREHGDEASHPTTNACDLLPQDMAGGWAGWGHGPPRRSLACSGILLAPRRARTQLTGRAWPCPPHPPPPPAKQASTSKRALPTRWCACASLWSCTA